MSFVIEKGIPLPTDDGRTKAGLAAALRSMDVGDSVVVPEQRRSIAQYVARRYDIHFVTRRIKGTKNIRIWRVEGEAKA